VTTVHNYVFKPKEADPLQNAIPKGGAQHPTSFPTTTAPLEVQKFTPAEYMANFSFLQQQQQQEQQQQMDMTQIQAQYNLWNTLSQVPNAAAVAAGISPGSDIWSVSETNNYTLLKEIPKILSQLSNFFLIL